MHESGSYKALSNPTLCTTDAAKSFAGTRALLSMETRVHSHCQASCRGLPVATSRACSHRAAPRCRKRCRSARLCGADAQRGEIRAATDAATDAAPGSAFVPSRLRRLSLLAVPLLAVTAALPEHAQAGEGVPPGLVGVLDAWLDGVAALGPWGPVAFIATVSVMECVPLFPTQPLTIGAGILFGAAGGAACNLVGLCAASTIAFTISKTFGKKAAEGIVAEETGDKPGALQSQLKNVNRAIESGSTVQQFVAIVLLRLTPIVPFSASNYVLGLSPVTYPPFIGATFLGMTVWSTVFASLGAAARGLLTSGMDLGPAISEVSKDVGAYSQTVIIGVSVLVVAGVGASKFNKAREETPEGVGVVGRLIEEGKEKLKVGASDKAK